MLSTRNFNKRHEKNRMRFVMLMAAVARIDEGMGPGIDYAKNQILAASNLYMLSGTAGADAGHQDAAGGRIGILTGSNGIFIVDAQYAQVSDKDFDRD
jgi:cyclase